MFPLDTFTKNAHDLTLATKMVRDPYAYEAPKAQADRPRPSHRLVPALAAAASLVLWLAWVVVS